MSYERKEGKDTIIFLSKNESIEPAKVTLEYDKDDEEHMGLIRPDGEINWNCPCLQGMADGPCGPEFKESFSCFHYSKADPKGSDCIDQFRSMQECFMKYPEVYAFDDDKDDDSGEGSKNNSDANQDEKPINDSKISAENDDEIKIDKAQADKDDSPSINKNSTDDKSDKSE